MEYLVAFQLLCGCFAGYVASHKKRNWFFWFLVGGAVPLLGVLAALMVEEPAEEEPGVPARGRNGSSGRERRPPSRCCGRYIPDCRGCPYFKRPLFDRTYSGARKGYCELFDKKLVEEPHEGGVKITIEEDESGPA